MTLSILPLYHGLTLCLLLVLLKQHTTALDQKKGMILVYHITPECYYSKRESSWMQNGVKMHWGPLPSRSALLFGLHFIYLFAFGAVLSVQFVYRNIIALREKNFKPSEITLSLTSSFPLTTDIIRGWL